jgi:hypothetical protein
MDFPRFSTRGQGLNFWFYEQVPGFHSHAPKKKPSFAIGSLGAVSGWVRRNPAKGGSGLAGKVVGDDEGLTKCRFEGLEAVEGAPGIELGRAMDGQPRELLLRRVGAQGEAKDRRGSFSGVHGDLVESQAVLETRVERSSTASAAQCRAWGT